ncbi:hypothetical protein [Nocardia sp. SSK8]|uniref:hypothetical protein n=1 Tax=Nocardia sp. SSK8 TaxID=3120154 RepID=UPI00300B3DDB
MPKLVRGEPFQPGGFRGSVEPVPSHVPQQSLALIGSVALAVALGVASDEILDSDEKVDSYFLD